MKYYSRKRIVLSILASVAMFFIVAVIIEANNPDYRSFTTRESKNPALGGLIAGVALLAVLLPKIWWNFVLNRIREISKAIKDND